MDRPEIIAEISRQIIAHRAAGLSVKEALDAVIGAGTYEALAGKVYDELRGAAARAGK